MKQKTPALWAVFLFFLLRVFSTGVRSEISPLPSMRTPPFGANEFYAETTGLKTYVENVTPEMRGVFSLVGPRIHITSYGNFSETNRFLDVSFPSFFDRAPP